MHAKMDIEALKGHAIQLLVVGMIMGTRVEFEYLSQRFKLCVAEKLKPAVGNIYLKTLHGVAIDKTRAGFCVAVGIGNVGLDVVNGGAVH